MQDQIIKVVGLGKKYRIGERQKESTLVGKLLSALASPLRNLRRLRELRSADAAAGEGIHEALSDVSFAVRRGEVLGIIGHNGAGKSTLLKLLSRITSPSSGKAVLNGRVASLLEVGTGFHSELTGRENVLMNGILLGMGREEVRSKFDQIVAFSGVGAHIDTPLKFYSSGMKVRLAFAVAAHLDPEILIIDEVLAVGDLAFQQKCLAKMDDVRNSGRTILFVSHDMAAVEGLCDRCLLLQKGRLVFDGPVGEAVERYRRSVLERGSTIDLAARTERYGSEDYRFTDLTFNGGGAVYAGEPLKVSVAFYGKQPVEGMVLTVRLCRSYRDRVMMVDSKSQGINLRADAGDNTYHIVLPSLPVIPGNYLVELWANAAGTTLDGMFDAATLVVQQRPRPGVALKDYDVRNGYALAPSAEWHHRSARSQVQGEDVKAKADKAAAG